MLSNYNTFYSFVLLCLCLLNKSNAQQIHQIDITHSNVDVNIIPDQEQIQGEVIYDFEILEFTDSLVVDARNLEILEVKFNGKAVEFNYKDMAKLKVFKPFKKGDEHKIAITYKAKPNKAMYFIKTANQKVKQIWTQGQGKYSSNWIPSFDDMNEKIEFDITISAPKEFVVLANGKLIQKRKSADQIIWQYDMKKPMSSYLLAIAMGDFDFIQSESKSGIRIKNYFVADQQAMAEPTFKYTKDIFDYYENEIGVDYPWQEYKQVGVQDFLYAGMENTTLTIFSDSYMVDSIAQKDRSYCKVNAHEMAHHWFGNLVTETEATHHWLQEGFATYYALLAAKHIFGDDYFYYELFKSAMDLKAQKPESLLNPKAGSLTFYQRGAWVLVALRDKIGERSFKKAIKTYLNEHAYKNVNTHDFFNVVMAKSQMDLDGFIDRWLVEKEFPFHQAKAILNKNELTRRLLTLDAMDDKEFSDFVVQHPDVYKQKDQVKVVDYFVRRASILADTLRNQVYKSALQSPFMENGQSVAVHISKIPSSLKSDFENLLTYQSYKTVEYALLKLSTNFPESLPRYLDQTKDIDGFRDKNVKTLWLALALITPDYQKDLKYNYYNTLVEFTRAHQPYGLRINAFRYLAQLEAFNEAALENLIQACLHPVWQFSKFSRQLLDKLIEQPAYRGLIEHIKKNTNKQEQRFLNQRLDQ